MRCFILGWGYLDARTPGFFSTLCREKDIPLVITQHWEEAEHALLLLSLPLSDGEGKVQDWQLPCSFKG